MAKNSNPLEAAWNTTFMDSFAKWAFFLSAFASLMIGGIELWQAHYPVGLLGITSALSAVAGGIATDISMKRRDEQHQFWRSTSLEVDPPNDRGFGS